MKKILLISLVLVAGCGNYSYNPHSQKQSENYAYQLTHARKHPLESERESLKSQYEQLLNETKYFKENSWRPFLSLLSEEQLRALKKFESNCPYEPGVILKNVGVRKKPSFESLRKNEAGCIVSARELYRLLDPNSLEAYSKLSEIRNTLVVAWIAYEEARNAFNKKVSERRKVIMNEIHNIQVAQYNIRRIEQEHVPIQQEFMPQCDIRDIEMAITAALEDSHRQLDRKDLGY